MINFRCIIPLSLFKRDTKEYLNQLGVIGGPILLTLHGRGVFVVEELNSYIQTAELAEYARQDRALTEVINRTQNSAIESYDVSEKM